MSKIVRVFYSKNIPETAKHDSSGTNHFIQNEKDSFSDCNEIVFELRQNSGLLKLKNIWNEHTPKSYEINYNVYESISGSQRTSYQTEMNSTVDSINSFNYKNEWKIDKNLKLKISEDDSQIDKLNALHRRFEDISYDMMSSNKRTEYIELYNLLERVNYLVHRMETNSELNNANWALTVIRNQTLISKTENILPLDSNDYNQFSPSGMTGKLYLDYCTVGKDLVNCWMSNDIELVKAKEVKQQTHAKPAINFTFHNVQPIQKRTNGVWQNNPDYTTYEGISGRYYKWCEENNVGDYIDYKKPMYNYGRLVIGDCINIKDVHEYLSLIEETPYLCGVSFE